MGTSLSYYCCSEIQGNQSNRQALQQAIDQQLLLVNQQMSTYQKMIRSLLNLIRLWS